MPLTELLLLESAHACDEAEVIIAPPRIVTFLPPAADVATRATFRISSEGAVGLLHAVFELCTHETVVCRIVEDAVGFCPKLFARHTRHNDVHIHCWNALGVAEKVGVEGKLQNRTRLGLSRELAVVHLV
jgi:hypothetical protein